MGVGIGLRPLTLTQSLTLTLSLSLTLNPIPNQIEALLSKAGVPAYNATEHASELDYLTELLFKAKLRAYRGELLGLLERWDAGELPMSVPLKRVEQLIDEGVLQPDVLMLPPDEYHDYHYDHDD